MTMKHRIYPWLLLAILSGPTLADEQSAADAAQAASASASPTLAELGQQLKSALTEEETALLFAYMRDSVLATFKDEEVDLPPELAFKLEVLQHHMKKVGGIYLDNLAKQLEADIRRSLKEKMKPSPPVPYTLPQARVVVPVTPVAPVPPPAVVPIIAPAPTYEPFQATPRVPPRASAYPALPWLYVPPPNFSASGYTPPAAHPFMSGRE
jgi:hypothetical protein